MQENGIKEIETEKGFKPNADGSKYDGDWKNDKKNGKGLYYWTNGDHYSGDWLDDHRTGNGVYYYKNGDIFYGQFKNSQRCGEGIYYFKSNNNFNVAEYENEKLKKEIAWILEDRKTFFSKLEEFKKNKIISEENYNAIYEIAKKKYA